MPVSQSSGKRRLRVLLIAEAANPEWVSVPLIGWSLATALAQITDAHIVTQIRNRDAFCRAGLREGIDFTAIDSEALERPIWRLSSALRGGSGVGWTTATAFSSLVYPYFERLVWRHFGADLSAGAFDLVHRITPLTPTAPSPLASRCARVGIPFVLGPLNGGVPWPREFDRERRREREWLSYLRWIYKLIPGALGTVRNSSAVIAGSHYTLENLPKRHRDKYVYLPENGIDPARFSLQADRYDGNVLNVCFVGRLVPYKGPDMLVEAAAPLLRAGKMQLHIIGDGPLLEDLRAQIAAEGLGSAAVLHGWVDHSEVQRILTQCHVLGFPSIREFGGGVVLEAMATGVVPLVVDYAGPGELVDDQVGVKVPMGPREQIVAGFRRALDALQRDAASVARMSRNGRERVQEQFTWEAKARRVHEVYDSILSTKPA